MSNAQEELIQAIVEWSRERPCWEQQALLDLARKNEISDARVSALADIAEREADNASLDVAKLEVSDFLSISRGSEQVKIARIAEPKAVNALTWPDGLNFAPNGITLVYGENGSGKSGYARVLKKVTRARHDMDILTNVFEAPAEQSALLTVSIDSSEETLAWPSDRLDFLSRVSFYDSECAKHYISTETEVAYRPSSIALLNELVIVANRVRVELQKRRDGCTTSMAGLPSVPLETQAAEFVASISASTTALDINLASELPIDIDDHLASLRNRIANLTSADLAKQRSNLNQLLSAITSLLDHITQTHKILSDDKLAELQNAKTQASVAREAADAASAARFASEAISGVGSASWNLLWEAARRFSEEVAYPNKHFPVTADEGTPGRCVLCQQELDEHASDRLRAFDQYVAADSERKARDAEDAFEQLFSKPRDHEVFDTKTELFLQSISASSEASHSELQAALQALEDRRAQILYELGNDDFEIGNFHSESNFPATDQLANESRKKLTDLEIDDPSTQLDELRKQEAEILGRQTLQEKRTAIESHISVLRKVSTIDDAIRLTSTHGITRRAAELTRTHVSDIMKHHFSQETLRLGLHRVRLADTGGGQGNLKHQAKLVNAVQPARLDSVLSEGEQTALGLAGFLTEVEGDPSNSAVVFDDPVTSLDHVCREQVAQRIIELASSRQVIIFTHDVAFVVDLKRAAEAASVGITERWVTKHLEHVGRIRDGSPWDAKMVGERLNYLERGIANLRSVYAEGDPEVSHKEARSWYQDLRLVWERALEEVVIGPVQVRGRLEIRPTNLKVVAQFTESDNQEFQTAFTRCGDRGSHDRSSELNRPLPEISELEEDLNRLRTWHKRVRGYAK
ncbi:AAA family ATPase [Candidatus Poriferisocius sp.]|uniref:AAA family ATPase n=1 Tax=Candidatus Poriferisocius sp. TaxID=3101276 RepID=UPI003B01AEFF